MQEPVCGRVMCRNLIKERELIKYYLEISMTAHSLINQFIEQVIALPGVLVTVTV
jgi:hypothetical protein